MKLIELLVQELQKRGGWPDGVSSIAQRFNGALFEPEHDGRNLLDGLRFDSVEGRINECVTREQYEAALAEAQQLVWNGEGLPPVGCDVEYDSYPDGWVKIGIVARVEDATFIVWKGGRHKGADIMRGEFPIERVRPIRSEADKKREAAIQALAYYTCTEDAEDLYAAILAGKVEGVKLDV